MREIPFTKYETKGAYHWVAYARGKMCDMTDYIVAHIKHNDHDEILDIGCGDGLYASMLGAKGFDTNRRAVELACSHQVDALRGSVYDVSGHWDAVLLFDTLEHLGDQDRAMRAIGNVTDVLYVLNPEPCDSKWHTREFTADELIKYLNGFGWKIVQHNFWDHSSRNKKTFLECRKHGGQLNVDDLRGELAAKEAE